MRFPELTQAESTVPAPCPEAEHEGIYCSEAFRDKVRGFGRGIKRGESLDEQAVLESVIAIERLLMLAPNLPP